MRWKLTCRDAADGSGDVIVDLPNSLLRAKGWEEGDSLELTLDPSDRSALRLSKVVICDVCDATTAETGHGVLQAQWRDGSTEGMRLCRPCFNYAMATLRRMHQVNHLFDDDGSDQ